MLDDAPTEEAATPPPYRHAGAPWWMMWLLAALTAALLLIGPIGRDMSHDVELFQSLAFGCGYRVHQDRVHHYDDVPIPDWCEKIKTTAAAHGFNP